MSKRVYELFLFDVYIAILKIEYVAKKFENAEALKYDFISWDSIIREFEIIGEATNILIKNSLLSKEHQVVVDLRNLLIHHYFGIDEDEIWDVIQNDLVDFKKLIIEKIRAVDIELKDKLLESLFEENMQYDFLLTELKKL